MSNYDIISFCESVISNMEWTNEKYLRFIDDYRKASVLWDVRNPDYKNNSKKRSVVAGLAQAYCVEEGALKKKIKNLRSAFHREHHRLTNKKGGSVDESRKWFAYDSLRFILDVAESCGGFRKEESSFASDEPLQHLDTEEDADFCDNANLIELPPLHPERSPENNANPALVNKEEDEYDLFGRSMAMQLRKMPELTALELMQKMQLMVLNSRKQLSNKKMKTKQRLAKPALHAPSTSNTNSKRVRSPSPDVSSQSSPSPCYFKFEVMSPTERDPASGACDEADRSFTYVTTVEHAEKFPVSDEIREDCTVNVPIGIQREMKRKMASSIDPLEVKQKKLHDTDFKD